MQTPKHLSVRKTQQIDLDYLLFLPQGYKAGSSSKWPLMLFLHGAGERGSNLSAVLKHGPAKFLRAHPEQPFILVAPQCPAGEVWSEEALLALLDDVGAKLRVDAKRVYLTGLSMGGYGTWNLGMAYPERFAAIAPICGGGEFISVLLANGEKGQALKTLGVWAFHGAKDPVVPPAESERMVNLLKKTGVADVQLTVYPEAGHDAWTETYNNPELYTWFLKHKRGKP